MNNPRRNLPLLLVGASELAGSENWTKTFAADTDFAAIRAAAQYLDERGFSLGRMQGPDPRGILFGALDIQKWRNLDYSDRDALHGVVTGSQRHGPVTITIYATVPAHVRAAITGPPRDVDFADFPDVYGPDLPAEH